MARIPPSTRVIRRGCPLRRGCSSCRCCPHCRLVVVFVATSSLFPSSSSSSSLSLLLLPLPTSLHAIVPMAMARLVGRRRRPRAMQPASSWPRRSLSRCWPSLFVFVVVTIAVADVLACHPLCGNSQAGGAGAVAGRDAAGLLLASAIVVAVPTFALALWMPPSFCSKMALLALAFLMVLALALALALTQLLVCSSTTPCVALIKRPKSLEWRPMLPLSARRSCPRLHAHPPCIPSAPPPLV